MKVSITGGTRGIGRAIATRFVEAGAEVLICGQTNNVKSNSIYKS